MLLHPDTLPRADWLGNCDTISEGYTCDLKLDSPRGVRIWLHRTSIEDGEPFRHTVTVECLDPTDHVWRDVLTYDGDDPQDRTRWIWTEYEHLIDNHQEGTQ